jgi:hypothetical protein
MSKAYKLLQKSIAQQREILAELDTLVKSIDRGEKMIMELKAEVEEVNHKHQDRKTTRDDVAYLEDLLRCAKKKLAWEKHMEGLGKRTPAVLVKVSAAMNDTAYPPSDEIRAQLVQSLQTVEASMKRLELAKVD